MANPPIELLVTMKDGKPTTDDVVLQTEKGPTTIIWTAGPGIASFEIVGLDANEFRPQNHDENKTEWMTVDWNTTPRSQRPRVYTYEITAQRSGGTAAAADPKITHIAG